MRPRTVGRRATEVVGSGPQAREPLPTRSSGLPSLPPGYAPALDAGLDRLGISLSPGVRAGLDAHVRLLVAWNAAINLTAIREPERIAVAHLLDSLAALPLLAGRGAAGFVDLGSGGGFPGLPLAVALRPERALLVDSIGKKVRFLGVVTADLEALGALGRGAVTAVAARAEELARDPRERERWPAVLARAVGPLPELIELAFPLLSPGGILVAWKRGEIADELVAGERLLPAIGGGRIALADYPGVPVEELAGHRFVVCEKAGPTPARFPRPPAERRRTGGR